MMEFLTTIWIGLKGFFAHFWFASCNVYVCILGLLSFLLGYPDRKYILSLVLVFFVLDFVTKFYAISKQNNGIINAFKVGRFNSRSFIDGFVTKVLGYFVILTMANFSIITPEISFIGNLIAQILYYGLFFYEIISNLENLRDSNLGVSEELLNKIRCEKDGFLKNIKNK